MTVVEHVLVCADLASELIDQPEVAAAWDRPSALDGYTVGGLAGHLARAVLTVDTYLAAQPPPAEATTTDASGYFAAVLADHDPVESDLHRTIRSRGQAVAADGPAAVATQMRETFSRLAPQLTPEVLARRVTVRDGIALTVEEYLRSRLVELVVHLDDLAVSVPEAPTPAMPDAACREVAVVLAATAARRGDGLAVVRSLARREREPAAARAL